MNLEKSMQGIFAAAFLACAFGYTEADPRKDSGQPIEYLPGTNTTVAEAFDAAVEYAAVLKYEPREGDVNFAPISFVEMRRRMQNRRRDRNLQREYARFGLLPAEV